MVRQLARYDHFMLVNTVFTYIMKISASCILNRAKEKEAWSFRGCGAAGAALVHCALGYTHAGV